MGHWRIGYLFLALFLGALGIMLLDDLFSDEVRAQGHDLLTYVVIGVFLAFWLGLAGYFALKIFKPPQVIVDAEGFTYEGIFRTTRMPWKCITTVSRITEPYYFLSLEFEVKRSETGTRRVGLDFTGLSPNHVAFISQVRILAPWIQIK